MRDRLLDPLEAQLRFHYLEGRMLRPAPPPPPVPAESWDERLVRRLGRLWALVVAYRRWIFISVGIAFAIVVAIVPEILLLIGAMVLIVAVHCVLDHLFVPLGAGIVRQFFD